MCISTAVFLQLFSWESHTLAWCFHTTSGHLVQCDKDKHAPCCPPASCENNKIPASWGRLAARQQSRRASWITSLPDKKSINKFQQGGRMTTFYLFIFFFLVKGHSATSTEAKGQKRPVLPSNPSAARAANERAQREPGSNRGESKSDWLAKRRWRPVNLRRSCSLRTGTILDPNWKVKRTFGFEWLIIHIMHGSHFFFFG